MMYNPREGLSSTAETLFRRHDKYLATVELLHDAVAKACQSANAGAPRVDGKPPVRPRIHIGPVERIVRYVDAGPPVHRQAWGLVVDDETYVSFECRPAGNEGVSVICEVRLAEGPPQELRHDHRGWHSLAVPEGEAAEYAAARLLDAVMKLRSDRYGDI